MTGDPSEAATSHPDPDASIEAESERLLALYAAGRFAEVAAIGGQLATRHPRSLMLFNIQGAACIGLRDYAGAERAFRAAIDIEDGHAELHGNLGAAIEPQGRLEEAEVFYRRALFLDPDNPSTHYNLGNLLRKQHAFAAAIASYERALALDAGYADAYNNLGLCYQAIGEPQTAIQCYREALARKPEATEALYNAATALMDCREYESAIGMLSILQSIEPDHFAAARQKSFCQMQICDFAAERHHPIDESAAEAGAAVPPFIMLAMEDDPEKQLWYSREWARTVPQSRTAASPGDASRPDGRVRVGYFSADFHDHATLCLMAGVFREHDRRAFEIFAYSYGPDSDDAARQTLIRDVDHFIDIRDSTDAEVLALAKEHRLDIAVDLKGYTKDSRYRLFVHRPAPVQIGYLGYPGSMGAEFIDYIIGDRTVIPDAHRDGYSEKVIFLPGSYQPNDDRRPIGEPLSRAAAGLPDKAFVFCCFNQAYKIGPAEFDVWMPLLKQTPDSVLWLLKPDGLAEANLRREAAARGVDPNRLIFAPSLPHADHLSRLRLADLVLDTFNYNAHTTASDALWAGVPFITKAGRQFAARVGASLLTAMDMPEFITESAEEYQALALDLASDDERLRAYRKALEARRASADLFDTRKYTRKLESAYLTAHRLHTEGRPPADIVVE